MKTIVYISRLGKEFYGGADNTNEYLIAEFERMHLENHSSYEVAYAGPEDFFDVMKDYKLFEYIFVESASLPEMEEIDKVLGDFKDLSKLYIYMHSPAISAEDVFCEIDNGPSLSDMYDASVFQMLASKGATLYYGCKNHAALSSMLLGSGEYFSLENFYTRNVNKENKIDYDRDPKAVLFCTGYYSPAVGIHYLMEMISKTEIGEYTWYIVGRPFDEYTYGTEKIRWKDYYNEILERPDVVQVPFTDDMSQYYKKCTYHLILSSCESYSFKAIEALSYGCINVSTWCNDLLGWSEYAILISPQAYKNKSIPDALLSCLTLTQGALKIKKNSFRDAIEKMVCLDWDMVSHYGFWLMSNLISKSKDFLRDTDYKNCHAWRYNRLTQKSLHE